MIWVGLLTFAKFLERFKFAFRFKCLELKNIDYNVNEKSEKFQIGEKSPSNEVVEAKRLQIEIQN